MTRYPEYRKMSLHNPCKKVTGLVESVDIFCFPSFSEVHSDLEALGFVEVNTADIGIALNNSHLISQTTI